MASATFHITDHGASRAAADKRVDEIARSVMQAARTGTPRGDTGNLARGWRVVRSAPASRLVINSVPYARFVEYGTVNMPAVGMLGRAVAQARGR
jgi:hypothetical protein